MSSKKHPWKICDRGETYVRAHKKTIGGKDFRWRAHCRKVKIKKQILNKDEIIKIADHFKSQKFKLPKSYNFKSKNGNKYDQLIGGWVHYWSELLGKDTNITPDFVKILMMTESSFNSNASATTHDRPGSAIGLMQITTYTHKLIQPESSELREHSFKVTRKDLSDPNVNISVGVRWLFRKREIAKYYLKSEPIMLQLAEEYKGLRGDKSVNAEKIRIKFKQRSKEYQNGKTGN